MEKMTFLNPEKQSREEQFLFKVVCLSPEAGSDYMEQLRNSFLFLMKSACGDCLLIVKLLRCSRTGRQISSDGRTSHPGGENFMTLWLNR
jgi:hypothetical protein